MLGVDPAAVGDRVKSWDVLATATFVEEHLAHDDPIVDFGAFRSEITGVLCRLGYTNLHAVDLNPRVTRGPYRDRIDYVVGDFLATGFPADAFACITAISAIEHGLSTDRLLAEVGRLLRPGGYFIASTDYWPDKVDTAGIRIFGMDWTIFSAGEMGDLVAAARRHGLVPAGALDYGAAEPPIHFADRHFTFAWLALRKGGG